MKSPCVRRILLIAAIVLASIGGLLFVLEYAPQRIQFWLTPDYSTEWVSRKVDHSIWETMEDGRGERLDHYSDLLEKVEPDQKWIVSEKYDRTLHVDFVRAEVMRIRREYDEFLRRNPEPEKPSYLRFLWDRFFERD